MLLFPLVGLYLIARSLVAYLRARKFQDLRLTLAGVPGAIGGRLQGRVEAAFVFPAGETVDLTLSCIRPYVSGSGNNRTRWETVLWQDKKTETCTTDGRRSFVPVGFAVPYDTSPTDTHNTDDAILWRLAASAKLPGLDFQATFQVPVFKTAASDESFTIARLEHQDEAGLGETRPRDAKVTSTPAPGGGVQFHFGAARNKQIAAAMSLFGAGFVAGGLFFAYASSQVFGWGIGVIPLTLAGGAGLFMFMFSVWLWFGVTNITVVNRELHIRSRCLGLAHARVIAAGEIRQLDLYPGMQQGDRVWYDLKIRMANGRSATAGSGLEKREAEWFRAELKKDLGIDA